MNNENRDFVIERLERQLKEKESEVENMKNTLHDSILREIRSDLKNDLDINNRITKVEQKVNTLSNNLNGIMDELLDQKSMIRSLRDAQVKAPKIEPPKVSQSPVLEPVAPQVYSPPRVSVPEPAPKDTYRPEVRNNPIPQTPVFTAPVRQFVPPEPSIPANWADCNVSRRYSQESGSRNTQNYPANVSVDIRDIAPVPEPVVPQRPEPKSEYIIAENDDERKANTNFNSRPTSRESCNYIVAEDEDEGGNRKQCEPELESIEARDDEDAVITVTRRK
jgi:hypothetical protein